MQLTTDILKQHIGGDIEIQYRVESRIYRGPISTAVVESNFLIATLEWIAEGVGPRPTVSYWVESDHPRAFTANLADYSVDDIGSSAFIEGGHRLCLKTKGEGMLIVLYPKDGSKLDRGRVKKLKPISA